MQIHLIKLFNFTLVNAFMGQVNNNITLGIT